MVTHPMLTTIRLDFDHDFRDKANRFDSFAAEVMRANTFIKDPLIENSPVFSYGSNGNVQLESLSSRLEEREAIIFLSDICGYAFAMVQSTEPLQGVSNVVSQYKTMRDLREFPLICGNYVPEEISLNIEVGSATFVGLMPSPYSSELVDEESETPNIEIVEVIRNSPGDYGSVFAYRLRDAKRFFESIVTAECVTYAIPELVDLDSVIEHYCRGSLTDFLLASKLLFGTLNENHQDDYFAVSYLQRVWRLPESTVAFVA